MQPGGIQSKVNLVSASTIIIDNFTLQHNCGVHSIISRYLNESQIYRENSTVPRRNEQACTDLLSQL